MEEERKGILTPEQEKLIDELIVLKGAAEAVDGLAIKLIDNYGLEVLKNKVKEKYPEALPTVFEIVDALMGVIGEIVTEKPV